MIQLKMIFTITFVILSFNSSALASEQFQFTSDVFKAFKLLYDANKKFDDLSINKKEKVLKEIDHYNETFYKALKIIEPYKKSKFDRIGKVATELSFSLHDMTKYNNAVKKKYDSNVITSIQSKNKYAAMFFGRLTEMVISTLVSNDNGPENKKLLITIDEQNRLIEQLETSFFGPSNEHKNKGDNLYTPYEIAASVMYYFLKPEAKHENP